MKANQKFMVPRMSGGNAMPLSRSAFLSGRTKVLYGPGQPPDAGSDVSAYVPPDDWPEAGSLLRVPQVAWLTLSVHDFDFSGYATHPGLIFFRSFEIQIYEPVYIYWVVGDTLGLGEFGGFPYTVQDAEGDGLLVSTAAIGQANTDGSVIFAYTPNPEGATLSHSTPATVGPTYHRTIPCPYIPEYSRILGIYRQAKEAIEALRPGRTWVQVIEPWKPDGDDGSSDNRAYFQSGTFDDAVYYHMVAPKGVDDYFGINFLHIYSGGPASTFAGPSWTIVDRNPLDDDLFLDSRAILRESMARADDGRDRFAGYAVRVYGLEVDFETFPAYFAPPLIPPAKPSLTVPESHYEGGDFFHQGTLVNEDQSVPWVQFTSDSHINEQISESQTSMNMSIEGTNNGNATADDAARAFLSSTCDFLTDDGLDFRYEGTTKDISVDALVGLVAEHFGFDPDTGKDIG